MVAAATTPPALSRTFLAGTLSASLSLALYYGRAWSVGAALSPTTMLALPLVLLGPGLAGALARDARTGVWLAAATGLGAPFLLGAMQAPALASAFVLQLAAFLAWRTGRLILASLLVGAGCFFDPRGAVLLVAFAIGEFDAHRAGDGTISPARSFAYALGPGLVLAALALLRATDPAAPFDGWTGVGFAVQRELTGWGDELGPGTWSSSFLWWPWLGAASLVFFTGGFHLLRRSSGERRAATPRLVLVAAIWTLLLEGLGGWATAERRLPLAAVAVLLAGVEGCAVLDAPGPRRRWVRVLGAVLGLGLTLGLWGSIVRAIDAAG